MIARFDEPLDLDGHPARRRPIRDISLSDFTRVAQEMIWANPVLVAQPLVEPPRVVRQTGTERAPGTTIAAAEAAS